MPAPCGDKTPGFYRRRTPRESPLFQLLEQHFDEFERVYPDRYQERYGFFRPVICKAVDAFLGCGDLREGFARVRCPDCGHNLFVAFSCKQRAKAAEQAKQSNGLEPLTTDESDTPYRKLCHMRWSALIKRVNKVDPLCCPKCGGTMAIVSFIEQEDQADVIERILKHCRLWDEYPARAPPQVAGDNEFELEVEYMDFDEFLMGF